MPGKFALAFPILSLGLLVLATPLEQHEVAPGLIEDPLKGTSNPIPQLIKDILAGVKSAVANNAESKKPLICEDACCVWWNVSEKLTAEFRETTGECNDNARAAIRFGFHDAGSWDEKSTHGGADGSLMMDFGEIDRPENNGLQSIRTLLRSVQSTYNVSYADLAQYAHNHATVTCPRGPRLMVFVGRKDAKKAAPKGLLPDVHDSADNLIALFQRKGISTHDLAALLGAHSSAKQRFVDETKANFSLDTTPGVWDTKFYNDTLQDPKDRPTIFQLPSDKVLSVHSEVKDSWRSFIGQGKFWGEAYGKAYLRVSLLGVKNFNHLVDCTETLPLFRANATVP
ncbi:class II peroxidase [Amniculicola lignicola CBS 123094]|uniref:Peroxidase n=1 Tax=Amniculicola lignicola CBS 123094 TaxID=1392246 RepID=A0A6A5VWT8_9PLEO|nr:class II peroxidase [Amniculicola lignicola CBS 123094]